jgi:hypothetical protein
MYLAVKAVCDAKPEVWQRSEKFEDAFADFCVCIENLIRLQPAIGIFQTVARGVAVELDVAETILTAEMDELIELFEKVDVAFVDDYTAARSMELPVEMFPAPLALPLAGTASFQKNFMRLD